MTRSPRPPEPPPPDGRAQAMHRASLTYSDYLALDEVLGAQRPRTGEHDEMLFIVVHQVYELWFKELLHELTHLQAELEQGATSHALRTLHRVLTILKVAVAQIDVLETMTPRQFAGFRSRLEAASGFQSAQFREIETVLGRRDRRVLDHYPEGSGARERIEGALERRCVWDSFLIYVVSQGYGVPAGTLARDVTAPIAPSGAVQEVLLEVYDRDEGAAEVCERLVDLDEGLLEWRYRHVKMVERTIGDQRGTGGSPGAAYLRRTLAEPLFPDLWQMRSLI